MCCFVLLPCYCVLFCVLSMLLLPYHCVFSVLFIIYTFRLAVFLISKLPRELELLNVIISMVIYTECNIFSMFLC